MPPHPYGSNCLDNLSEPLLADVETLIFVKAFIIASSLWFRGSRM